ncbi:MAG: DUF3276 family protein [Planctomycetes bacterium]|nr:DUF3276 family protein [Planctomycetota bacterium]
METNQKQEIYSKKIISKGKSYFFNIREAKNGNKYFSITQMKWKDGKRFYDTIFIFKDHIDDFKKAFDETIQIFAELPAETESIEG